MEWLNGWCGNLRWSGNVIRMKEVEFLRGVCESKTEGCGIKERPPVKWINSMDERWREEVGRQGTTCRDGVPEEGNPDSHLPWPSL